MEDWLASQDEFDRYAQGEIPPAVTDMLEGLTPAVAEVNA